MFFLLLQGALTDVLKIGYNKLSQYAILLLKGTVFMKSPVKRVSTPVLITAFLLMLVLLGGMVFGAMYHGHAIRFGFVPSPHAFGLARLAQASSPQHNVTLYDQEETVLRALDNQVLDAALVSVENALALPEDTYEIRGVFSVTDLLAVSEEETVLGMQSLSGRKLVLPETLRGSKEESMLLKLLGEADCAGYTLVYARDAWLEYTSHPGAVLLITLQQASDMLSSGRDFTARFRLSNQWRSLLGSIPPASYCVVTRRDVMGTGTFSAFEKHVRDSMIYSDRKRKKTIAMAVETGILANEKVADRLIDHMSFSYHEGGDAELSMDAWQSL